MLRLSLRDRSTWLLLASMLICAALYWPGLKGGFVFDDYPNIVDNSALHIHDARLSSLASAALSSPSSKFKRPLASLSFAANYLATGPDPYWMKATNVAIHLLNGLLFFLLGRALLLDAFSGMASRRAAWLAAWTAAGWMLLPINLTAVLYVVQRMESLANVFVLLGLLGYMAGRRCMLGITHPPAPADASPAVSRNRQRLGFAGCVASLGLFTLLGAMVKETAVLLPLYAALIEAVVYRGRRFDGRADRWIIGLFTGLLALPLIVGLIWLAPRVLSAGSWARRDFTLTTRLLSEARIVVDYIGWTLAPTPGALSFYHDDFHISTGLLSPWTTLTSLILLVAMGTGVIVLRHRQPIVALGIAFYLGCHLLTATVLPLELIYEHRNYFASFGVLFALVPWLAASRDSAFSLPRHVLLGGLLLEWALLVAVTAHAWGNPLRMAEDLASRAPASPRAQYELGRTYIIYSGYDPLSRFIEPAYAALERAAALPGSSILPEQALIFMNARMDRPMKDAWWNSMIAKLGASKPGVQDESSLGALTQCAIQRHCKLPNDRMVAAFLAALSHNPPSARLLAIYSDYAWNLLEDRTLAMQLVREAIAAKPGEAAYRVTEIRMLVATGRKADARQQYNRLSRMNIAGELDDSLQKLRPLIGQ